MKSRALVMFILLLALAVLISACVAKVEMTTTTLPSATSQSTINTPLPSPLETSKDTTLATTASYLIINKVSLSGYYTE